MSVSLNRSQMKSMVVTILEGVLSVLNDRLPSWKNLENVTQNGRNLEPDEIFGYMCEDYLTSAGSILSHLSLTVYDDGISPHDALKICGNFYEKYKEFFVIAWSSKDDVFEAQQYLGGSRYHIINDLYVKTVGIPYPDVKKCADAFCKYLYE